MCGKAFFCRKERKLLLNRPPQDWLNTGIALTEDSRCKNQPPPFKLFSRSRLAGSKAETSKLLTLNVFLNYYSEYDTGDTGLRIFNEWIKLV